MGGCEGGTALAEGGAVGTGATSVGGSSVSDKRGTGPVGVAEAAAAPERAGAAIRRT
jgi:hypothetical protein